MQINSVLKTHMANVAALLRARVIRLHVCWFIYFLICVYIYMLFCPSGCLYLLVRKSIIHTYVFMPVHMCTMHMWHLSIQVSNYIQSNLSVSVSIIYIKCGVDLYWLVHTRVCVCVIIQATNIQMMQILTQSKITELYHAEWYVQKRYEKTVR